ncbi:uncharacterized protein LOC116853908 [Odontomachus brunneus]|uniref:uncharacterized protein LOC116853908 n=1 Tax=Odontomachus brunneus TaxID=486640 RepID=UPI0013F1E8CB|nr:uncharacterized protein LOC116853908 [Odontomachus brunneus]
MHVLEFTLSVLTVAGGWRPLSWTSLTKQIIYNAYSILLNAAVFIFITTQFMHLVFNAINADEICETLYVVLVGMIGNFKIITIGINHQSFAAMLDNLSQKPFKPMVEYETMIQTKFEKMIKNNTTRYIMLLVSTVLYMTSVSLFTDFSRKQLTFNAWFPFDYSVSVIYYFLYIHQMISLTLCSLLNIACDCFFSGLLLHISCQIEILEYRLSKVANNQVKLRECVIHHYRIFEFASVLNDKLVIVIGSQFIGTFLVLCCLLFRLTISTSSSMYIETMMCICCGLIATSYYCWFGNEIRLSSLELSENIYKMKWLELSNSMRKSFLIIMNRATSLPIKFTSARIIPLNLESFVTVLKISYSVFNLMRQRQEGYQLLELILNANNADSFGDALFNILISLLACYKTLIIRINQESIIALINNLTEAPFKPLDSYEMMIREKFDRRITYAYMLNDKFARLVPGEFAMVTIVMTYDLIHMIMSSSNAVYVQSMMFIASTLAAIFYYCWFGNELKLKSLQLSDNIYNMEWMTLNDNVKKGLLMIMNRATIPIEFKGAYMPMNLESFVVPFSWTSNLSIFKYAMYIGYKTLLISILFTFNVTQFMNIALNVGNSDEFANTIYMMLTVFVAFYKIIIMWLSCKNVTGIVIALTEKPFAPKELGEITIRQKYDKISIRRKTAIWYLSLVMTTVVCMIFTSVFVDFMGGSLTYPAWLPFNYTSSTLFPLVFVHQTIAVTICATVNVACDSLICGLLLHICCQLEIFEYRLMQIPQKQHILPDCVRHHDRIFEYAYTVNSQFVKIIALQFGVSTLVVCSNLFHLAMATLDANILPLILYTACMLSQIFIYCWFGNEVKLKSLQVADNVYKMEWMALDNSIKKSLLLIMKRSASSIEFTSAVVITMNLDSFVSVLKTSYSVFNVLKRTHE